MSTTALVVELLIVGVQATVWMALFLLAATNWQVTRSILSHLSEAATLVAIPYLAVAYTAGVVVERIAGLVFKGGRIRRYLVKKWPCNALLKDMHQDETLLTVAYASAPSSLIRYIRHRFRIVRASAMNMVLTLIAMLTFMRCFDPGIIQKLRGICASAIILILVLLVADIISMAVLQHAYDSRVEQAEHNRLVAKACSEVEGET